MRALRRRMQADEGLTVVELLVVTLLLGIVGSVVTTSVIQGMHTSREAQERIHALTDLEAGTHRATRELRAANPLWPGMTDESVTATIYRDGTRYAYTYEASADGSEFVEHRVEFEDEESATAVSDTSTVIADGLDQDSVTTFRFYGRDGELLDLDDEDFHAGDVSKVAVTLGAELSTGELLEVETAVAVRNAADGG